jgi:polysaccharide export outer membrane protein
MFSTVPLLLLAAGPANARIDHQPVDCMVKDRFVQLDAAIDPPDDLAKTRVYFRSAEDTDSYIVDMALMQGRYVAKLPKPKGNAGPINYVIEATWSGGAIQHTPEISAKVVDRRERCGEGTKTAAEGSGDDVRIISTTSSRLKPKGFKGVASVVVVQENVQAADAPVQSTTAEPPKVAERPAEKPADRPAEKTVDKPADKPAEAQGLPKPSLPSTGRSSPDDDYMIGPQDILKITVFGHEDLTQSVIIQNDGTFFFSLLGRVKGADMSPKELERKLTTLLSQGYLRNPLITVMMQEYRSKSVFVMGEVQRPGSIPYTGNMTVMEMLARVGPTAGAGSEVMILRPQNPSQEGPTLPMEGAGGASGNSQVETLRVNIRDIQMGQLDKNIRLKPNDTVFVTTASRVYLLGEVRNPGPQTYGSGLTVRQAVTNAGGFTADAAKGKIIVGRQIDGQYKEVKVKLDDPLQPGDTVTVKAKLF